MRNKTKTARKGGFFVKRITRFNLVWHGVIRKSEAYTQYLSYIAHKTKRTNSNVKRIFLHSKYPAQINWKLGYFYPPN